MSYCNKHLTKLPPLPENITTLDCSLNWLVKIDKLPASLTYVNCTNNCLTSLPERLPENLVELYCSINCLPKLPERLPTTLRILFCWKNRLIKLPEKLPEILELDCRMNLITKLPKLPDSLINSWIYQNEFLFNIGNNLKLINYFTMKNYRILVKLQIISKREKSKMNVYMNRDISRECGKY